MSAFAVCLDLEAPQADRDITARLTHALAAFGAAFGAKVETAGAGRFACVLATSPVGRKPSHAQSDRGVFVVALSRFDARTALAATLSAPAGTNDAGLLLLAHETWGDDLLHHISGDFAFVLWDAPRQTLIAATDQFGTRPLFHARAGNRLLISDSIPVLRDSGPIDLALDEDFIGDMLCLGFATDPGITVYTAIRRIPAGHSLTVTNGALRVDAYYRIAPHAPLLLYRNPQDYADQFRDLFFDAVGDRIPEKGPIAILLSGGMDSTAVAAGIRHRLGATETAGRVTGYTVVMNSFEEQEGHYAALAAKHLGIPLTLTVAEDYIRQSKAGDARWRPAQPGIIPQLSPQFAAAMAIAPYGGALFSGLAGDALLVDQVEDVTRIVRAEGWRSPLATARYVARLGLPGTGLRDVVRAHHHRRRIDALKPPPWIAADFARRIRLQERLSDYFAASHAAGLASLNGVFWSNLVSLGASGQTGLPIESCNPFLDVRLADFAARLPAAQLRHKQVLRNAMAPLLPQEVVRRPKTPLGYASLANQREAVVQARQEAGIAAAPGIGAYIDLPTLRRCIAAPEIETTFSLSWAEGLAYWLAAA
ncbi:asparagine synthase-related protein [Sphingomonas sp. QA11]|uniref:asparagine synthase-related protein n=1 Tax=Sphingomonas sp. QA11 TaxID=2950605 RepID=UPI00234BFB5C|nr:asparagine synthase-related protein [Sphingomonas sp. QA11]WCM26973.1 asparagine synthase-related protein [Sphingomonas sp. QA11]